MRNTPKKYRGSTAGISSSSVGAGAMTFSADAIEAARVANLWVKINNVSAQITKYENAKVLVEGAQSQFDTNFSGYKDIYQLLSGNSDYTNIEKTDKFEGEMAEKLKEYISTYMSETDTAKTDGKSVAESLTTQISSIDDKLEELQTRKANLMSQL